MKALLNGKILTATIVTAIGKAEEYRELINSLGITLELDKVTHDLDAHVFRVKDLKMADLHLFDKNDAENCFVHYYEVVKDDYFFQFYTDEGSRREKFISGITIYHTENEGTKNRKIADIYSQKTIGETFPYGYTLNWGAWGSVSVDTARIFGDGIKHAIDLMNKCDKQFTV